MLNQGDTVGVYQVLSVIGRGGFGIVYRGNHQELGIEVAIKEYFPHELCVRHNQTVEPSKPEFRASFEESLDRFIKEAKQLEKFRDCPNIVTCRDFFRANGTAYIVMDYVQGLPLSVLLEQREEHGQPFTENDLFLVVLPLLTGLQTVHESGVCHRDIKPSNILIRRKDHAPVLIDFGAAKHEISMLTKSFAPYSDGYAAMEQVGEGEIGPWTDIYGVGAVMWRMVAGGASQLSSSNPVTIQRRAFELMQGRTDPLPSATEIGDNRFSDRTLKTIDDCLIINVSDRLQSCNELMGRLSPGNLELDKSVTPKKGENNSSDILFDQAVLLDATKAKEVLSTALLSSHSNPSTDLMTTEDLVISLKAESIARQTSVTGWFYVGLFLGFIGLLIAYGRSPDLPIGSISNYSGDDRHFFEQAYLQALKAKQINATWRGCILGNGVSIFLLWIIY